VQPVVDRGIADIVAAYSQNKVVDLQFVHSLLLARDRLDQSVGSKAEVRAGAATTSSTRSARRLSGSARGTARRSGAPGLLRGLSVGIHWGSCIAVGGDVLHELVGWLGVVSSGDRSSVLWNGCTLNQTGTRRFIYGDAIKRLTA